VLFFPSLSSNKEKYFEFIVIVLFLLEKGKIEIKLSPRDGNGYPMGRVLQCPSPYPHLKKIPVPVPIPSWATT